MSDLTLTAQLALANATLATIQLPQGIALAGDAFIKNDQIMVPIADEMAMESRDVTLASLTGPSGSRLAMPMSLRGDTAASAVQASRPVTEASVCTAYDSSLDRSYLPTADNLDEILRQLASCDATQAHEGYEALQYLRDQARQKDREESHRAGHEVHTAEEDLERQITAAKERVRIECGDGEAQAVDQNYQEFREDRYQEPALPQQTNQGPVVPSNGASSSHASGGGSGGGSPGGTTGGSAPVALGMTGGSVIVGSGDVVAAAFVSGVSAASDPSAALSGSSGLPSVGGDAGSASAVRPRDEVVDGALPIPAPYYFAPVTVSLQSNQIPEVIGDASISGQRVEFFQTYLPPSVAEIGGVPLPVANFLTYDSPEAHPYIEAAGHGTARLLADYWRQPRIGSLERAHQPVSLAYRYDSDAGGIVVSIVRPGGSSSGRSDTLFGESGDSHDEPAANPFDRIRRFAGRSLASIPIGTRVTREPELGSAPSVFIPIPFAVFAGIRIANDVRANPMLRPNGAATEHALSRVAHRGNHGDQRDGDGRSRGNGGQQGEYPQNQEGQPEEEMLVA